MLRADVSREGSLILLPRNLEIDPWTRSLERESGSSVCLFQCCQCCIERKFQVLFALVSVMALW